MTRRALRLVVSGILAVAILSGCPGAPPDLVPVPLPAPPGPPNAFCRHPDGSSGKLIVTVRNLGSDAPASQTRVEFSTMSGIVSATEATPAITMGASTDVLFDIPPDCYKVDCFFKIAVDANGQVNESNEANNTADGLCIG
jgi:hypothetical protein